MRRRRDGLIKVPGSQGPRVRGFRWFNSTTLGPDLRPLGPSDPRTLGPWDPGTLGPWDLGTLGPCDLGTLGPLPNSQILHLRFPAPKRDLHRPRREIFEHRRVCQLIRLDVGDDRHEIVAAG